jgi:hypothetical protein
VTTTEVKRVEATVQPQVSWSECLTQTFPERRLWRDRTDLLLFLLCGPAIIAIVLAILGTATFLAFGCLRLAGWNAEEAAFAAVWIGLAALIDFALLIHLPAFREVTAAPEGLLFRRYVGPPKRVSWADLVRVSVPPRLEVCLRFWLWPGLPLRGSLLCGSGRQFLLEWRGGRYYFGPQDMDGFVEAVRRWKPDLVAALHREEWSLTLRHRAGSNAVSIHPAAAASSPT